MLFPITEFDRLIAHDIPMTSHVAGHDDGSVASLALQCLRSLGWVLRLGDGLVGVRWVMYGWWIRGACVVDVWWIGNGLVVGWWWMGFAMTRWVLCGPLVHW